MPRHKGHRHGSVCATTAAALLAASPSHALEWSYTPGASVGAVNDTNIRLLFEGAEPVNAMSASASLDVLARNERFEFHAVPHVSAWRYDDPTVDDRDNAYANANVTLHGERQTWSIGVDYADEGTRNSAFESNGYPAVDLDRRQTVATTSWTRRMAHGEIDLVGSATGVAYQDALLSPYRDYRYNVFQGAYTWSANERSRWGVSVTRSEVTTNRGLITTASLDARATWTHVFSETLQAHVSLGELLATTEGFIDTRDTAPAVDFGVTRTWPFWRFTAGGGRQLQPDGQGSLLRQDRVDVSASRRLTQRLDVTIGVAKAQEKYLFNFYDRDYWQETASVSWRFKRHWLLGGSVTDRGQQWVTLGLPKQTGVLTQFLVTYQGGH